MKHCEVRMTPGTRQAALLSLALCLAAGFGGGCATKSAPDSGYLSKPELMTAQRERYPFNRVWLKPGVTKEQYDSIIVAQVNTGYLLENTGWKAVNPANANLDKAVTELARYTEDAFIRALSSEKNRSWQLATLPGPRTVVLELAIVELVPNKALLGAVGLVAPAMISVPANVAKGTPSCAIEGRIRHSQTGEVLFMFADRRERQMRVVDVKAVTWWSHAKDIVQDWARESVLLLNTPADYQVKERSRFTLKPW